MKTAAVTAVILTLNEQEHLPDCLASVAWADAVLIVDSGSTDGTVRLAEAAGATVSVHEFVNYSRQRQRALALVATPWTLFVDADERVSPDLAAEIRASLESIPHPGSGESTAGGAGESVTAVAGFWIPRSNVFWGRTLRGGGWWPDAQLRLLRTDAALFDPLRAVHELPTLTGESGRLTQPLVHLNYASWAEFRAKQRAYAVLGAEHRLATGDRVRALSYIARPVREVWRRFVRLEGWRDGLTGAALAAHMGAFELLTLATLRRLRQRAAAAGTPAPR